MARTIFVIGGGSAGFFSAITAAEQNPLSKIIIFEKLPSVLGKVKISGGGRCNVTNSITDPKELIKYYPRGGKQLLNVLYRFNTKDTISWFENKNIKLKIEEDGRIFPVSNNSQTIIDCLVNEAIKNNIDIKTGTNVIDIEKINTGYNIKTSSGNFECDSLIITTGSSSRIWEIIASLGHRIIEPVPSLFTFNLAVNNEPGYILDYRSKILELTGVSVLDSEVKIAGTKLKSTGPLLITHWGFSGPAILKLSAFGAVELSKLNYKFELVINWLPQFNHETLKESFIKLKSQNVSKTLNSFAPFNLPKRLWSFILLLCGVEESKKWNDLSALEIRKLADEFLAGKYNISGKSTFKEEFVTAGGVDLSEVDMSTMESKINKNLYFAGEVLNIDGITGGFNFQSAWSTGYVAGASQKS